MPRVAGHREGVESVRDIVETCGQLGVKYLTVYAFSTENWKRPQDEVSVLMRLLLGALRDETDRLNSNNVRLCAIGDLEALPSEVSRQLREGIEKTSRNTGLTLNLALSYSGRWDLTRAIRRIAGEVARGKMKPEDIDDACVNGYLSTAGIPDPDLLVRTSGEFRISNFLLWQLAYTELWITRKCWPEFRRRDLYEAIADYQRRERRFGLVSEQLRPTVKRSSYWNRILRSVTGP
jgi:undecaprenyl diphosphate synthase